MPSPLSEGLTTAQGGYNLQAISKSALAVTRTLMGEPPDRMRQTAAALGAVQTVQQVKTIQSAYWRSLYPKGSVLRLNLGLAKILIDPVAGIFGGERLHGMS